MIIPDEKVSVHVNVFGLPYEFKVDAESKEKLIECAKKLNRLISRKSRKMGESTSQIKILTLLCLDFLSDQIDSEETIVRIDNLLDKSL